MPPLEIEMICSSVSLDRFTVCPPMGLDSGYKWRSFRGAGHRPASVEDERDRQSDRDATSADGGAIARLRAEKVASVSSTWSPAWTDLAAEPSGSCDG